MCLDICAYGEVNPVEAPTADELDDVEHFYLHGGDWADREEGVPKYARCGEELAYACFTYSGYYAFRQLLGEAVWGIDIWADQPEGRITPETLWIRKLINYSDREGAFGPAAAGEIAAAMTAQQGKFAAYCENRQDGAWWVGAYKRRLNVFTAAAAHNGVVKYC